jgi:ribonuclease HII
MAPIVPTLRHERRLWNEGFVRVVGVDEVGVAPTCGAVVAAAVIMRPGCHRIPGVRDSKTLSAGQRERLAPIIRARAVAVGVGAASVVAKVVRDRMMERLAARYPGYGWERNQGYATLEHRMAIRRLGLTPFHRRSFLALQRTLAGDQLELDLMGDPAASAMTHELLARELVPVMADDAMLDALDLESLELGASV